MDKRTLLLTHPIQLIITCVAPPSGGAPSRFSAIRHFGVNDKQRIFVHNKGDKFCMFYALVLSRRFHDHKLLQEYKQDSRNWRYPIQPDELISCWSFERTFHPQIDRQQPEVFQLLHEANIPPAQSNYGIKYLPLVQQYWDRRYPGMYRIVAFESLPELEVNVIIINQIQKIPSCAPSGKRKEDRVALKCQYFYRTSIGMASKRSTNFSG